MNFGGFILGVDSANNSLKANEVFLGRCSVLSSQKRTSPIVNSRIKNLFFIITTFLELVLFSEHSEAVRLRCGVVLILLEFCLVEAYADLQGTRGVFTVCNRLVDNGDESKDNIGFDDLDVFEICGAFAEKPFWLPFELLVSELNRNCLA